MNHPAAPAQAIGDVGSDRQYIGLTIFVFLEGFFCLFTCLQQILIQEKVNELAQYENVCTATLYENSVIKPDQTLCKEDLSGLSSWLYNLIVLISVGMLINVGMLVILTDS